MNSWRLVEQFFGWLLQTSWHAAVLVVLVLLAQWLLRNRLSPGWRYGLWFLLVARLLMPVTLSSAVSVFNLAYWSRPKIEAPALASAAAPEVDTLAAFVIEPSGASQPAAPAAPPAAVRRMDMIEKPSPNTRTLLATGAPASKGPAQPIHWMAVAARFWAVGALLLALRFVWIELGFRRRLKRCPPLRDAVFQAHLDECASVLGLHRNLRAVETADVETPAVYGLWRKRLLLPVGLREGLSPARLRHVLLHELAHVKRRDPELNWLLALLQILHWFNPLLWLAFARMRADRELATDDLALARTSAAERCSYGETILQVLEGLTHRPAWPGLVGIGESKAQIKERMHAIARGAGPRWKWAAGAVAVVIAGLALTNARDEVQSNGVDLLKRYPTTLKAGDAVPSRARPWEFTPQDIYRVVRFKIEVGQQLSVEVGSADVGIGHCRDGAVWAVVLPRDGGTLTNSALSRQETVAHIWLRFHPNQINRIFLPETVAAGGNAELEPKIRQVAETKLGGSWHAGNRVMIPEPKDMTVDVDTQGGPRRFFVVDTQAQTAQYVSAFDNRPVEPVNQPAYEPELDTNCASVVSVAPANGAREVEPKQPVRIRFDRPMNPYNFKLEWVGGGFQLNGPIQVSADGTEFTVPVQLMPGEQKLVVNRDQERERWIAFGRRPEMKPEASARAKPGFADNHGKAANEFRWAFWVKSLAPKEGAAKPRMVSVSPPSGATTPVLTPVEITFDQPMRPPDLGLPYLQKNVFSQGPNLMPSVESDATGKRFTFPVLLRSDDDIRLVLRGFYSAEGVDCEPIVLHYQTGTEGLDPKYLQRAQAAAKDPKLLKLLNSMQQARARLHSGIETVQTVRLGLAKTSYTDLEGQTTTFKWQGNQVYGDFSGPMSMRTFVIGSNGRDCWLYSENEKGEKRLDQTPAAITERNVLLLDPFDLQSRPVEDALSGMDLICGNNATLEGHPCYRLEQWEVNQDNIAWATLTQWWIDEQTFLPRQIVQFYPAGCQIVRFEFARLNESIPDSEFQPPASLAATAHAQPLFFRNPPEPGERRFIRVCDGSNGRMSGRFGWQGPNGTTSSGLN